MVSCGIIVTNYPNSFIEVDEVDEAIDLKRLSELITTHLRCYRDFFKHLLKPKHHFLLHYVMVIMLMGPVVRFWSLRMEAKHQFFKRVVYKTKSFVNIKKSLAYKHQEHFFLSPPSLTDDVSFGKSTQFLECENIDEFIIHLKAIQFTDEIIERCKCCEIIETERSSFQIRYFSCY